MFLDNLQKLYIGFLNTPPLWHTKHFGIKQFDFPKIDLVDFKPKTIPSNLRLGHQIEYVFKQLIEYHKDYEILLHNLAIRNKNRTIGEIDFIIKNIITKELIHIELTYKFYIINSEISNPYYLIGPNKRDIFFSKVKKIKSQQFKLPHIKEGLKALHDYEINPNIIKHQTCFKAQLFEPYKNKTLNISPLNKNCITGYWLRFNEYNTEEFKKYKFYIPKKSEWVIEPHTAVEWMPHFKTSIEINRFLIKKNAPLVWLNNIDTNEFEKFFVIW